MNIKNPIRERKHKQETREAFAKKIESLNPGIEIIEMD